MRKRLTPSDERDLRRQAVTLLAGDLFVLAMAVLWLFGDADGFDRWNAGRLFVFGVVFVAWTIPRLSTHRVSFSLACLLGLVMASGVFCLWLTDPPSLSPGALWRGLVFLMPVVLLMSARPRSRPVRPS